MGGSRVKSRRQPYDAPAAVAANEAFDPPCAGGVRASGSVNLRHAFCTPFTAWSRRAGCHRRKRMESTAE